MKYLDFIRKQKCLVGHGCLGITHAHHVRTITNSAMGKKPDDLFCIPLCFLHHQELHQKGKYTFYRKYNIDIDETLIKYNSEYEAL